MAIRAIAEETGGGPGNLNLGKQIHGEEGQPAPAWMRPWHQQHGWAWSSQRGSPPRLDAGFDEAEDFSAAAEEDLSDAEELLSYLVR